MALILSDLLQGNMTVKESMTDGIFSVAINTGKFEKKNFKVRTLTDKNSKILVVTGFRKTVVKKTGEKRLYEFSYSRQINVAKLETLNARVENGFLTISVETEKTSGGTSVIPISG